MRPAQGRSASLRPTAAGRDRGSDGCDPCPLDSANDSDGNFVCDSDDQCPGFDDALDLDGDGQPNLCDPCPTDTPDDTDGDGICDSSDVCEGDDDALDTDGDGVPNGCDTCASKSDIDGDGFADDCDICPGVPDLDLDKDGVPDGCPPVDSGQTGDTGPGDTGGPGQEDVPAASDGCDCDHGRPIGVVGLLVLGLLRRGAPDS